MVPMNLLRGKKSADYIHTGEWAKKAIGEAKKFCAPNIAASSEDRHFSYVPAQSTWKAGADPAYAHITSNETIGGIQYHWVPATGAVPLVADMSSDILSRPVEVEKYGVIYAGAQKNIGPAGLTIVIVRDDLIGGAQAGTPAMFDYKVHADNESMYNTPATYGIYIAGLVFQWLKKNGGLTAMHKLNLEKAGLIYDVLDRSAFYSSPVAKADRSIMNVPFRLKSDQAGQGGRHDPAQGPPLGRRHAGLDLQRHAARWREGAGRLHARFREAQRLRTPPWIPPRAPRPCTSSP
jgi:phosphoserine aminotransferase